MSVCKSIWADRAREKEEGEKRCDTTLYLIYYERRYIIWSVRRRPSRQQRGMNIPLELMWNESQFMSKVMSKTEKNKKKTENKTVCICILWRYLQQLQQSNRRENVMNKEQNGKRCNRRRNK